MLVAAIEVILKSWMYVVKRRFAFFAANTYDRHIIALNAKGDLLDYARTAQGEVGKAQVASFDHIVDMAAYYSGYDYYRQIVVATHDGNIHEVCYPQ